MLKKENIKSIDNPPPLKIELNSGDDNNQFAENIINTVREPLIVLDQDLKVVTASRSFYNFFKVNVDETIGKLIYDLGNKQWNIPKLRELLETILPEKTTFDNYEVEHKFSTIGKRIMLLNARQIERAFGKEKVILLAIEDITERKHKEEALSEKNRMTSQYLDILLDHAHAPIIIWNSSLVIKRFNHEFEKLSGYSSAEVIDKKIDILFPEDEIDLTLELIKNNISDDKSEILDIDILTKDKDIKTVLWNSSNIFDEEEKDIVATIAQDITRHRRTEEALSASEAKTRTILEAISTGIIIVDPETHTIEDINSEAVRLIGEKKEKIVGSSCHKYICSAETEKCPITKLGQKIDNSEHILINKEGKRIPILKTVTQINLGGRKLLLENFTDITERIHAEETLHESEAKLDEAMKIAKLGTWEYDVAQDQFKFNDQFYKILHTTAEREGGYFMPPMQYAKKFVHPDDMVLVRAEIKKALETTDPNYISRLDHRIIYSDGKTGYFNVNIRILKDSQGRTVKTYGVNQDITAGKNAEEKIRNLAKFPSENPSPVLRIAKNGTLLYVNETGLKQLPEWNLQTEHTAPNMLMDVVSNILNIGEKQEVEFEHSEKIYSFHIVPIVESEYVNLYGQDITERKQADKTLKRSEKLLNSTGKIAKVGGWELDIKTNKVTWSEETYLIHEVPLDKDPTLEEAINFYHPDDLPILQEAIKNAVEKAEPFNLTLRFITAKGNSLFTSSMCEPIVEDGEVVKLIGTFQDITESKKAVDALKRSEDKLKEAQKIGKIGSWEFDIATQQITWSEELYNLVERDPMQGPPNFEENMAYFVPDDSRKLQDQVRRAIENGELYDDDYQLNLPSGKQAYQHNSVKIIKDENGRVTKLLGIAQDITERKLAEEKILENEKRFIELFDNAPIGYHELDNNGRITRINQTEINMLGYSREEMVGQFIWTFTGDEKKSRQRVIDKLKGILPAANSEERIYKRKDQTTFSGLVEENILHDSENNIIGIRTTIQNITKLKNTQNELRKLSRAVEQSPTSVTITNPYGDIEYVNEKFCRLTGYKLKEVIGKNARFLNSGQQNKEFYEELWNTILSGKVWQGEMLNKKKNGELYWVSSLISPLLNDNGDITNFIAIKEDITEQKKIRSALLISEERYNAIFNASLELVYIFDLEGQILEVNNQALNLFGYTLEESKSINLYDLLEPDDLITASNNIDYVVANGVNQGPQEYRVRTHKGEELFIETSAVRLDKDGKPYAIMGIARNITERKHAEKVMVEAKEKAEEMNRLKSNFLANMSHELRTPLIGILGYADLLGKELKDEDLIEMAKTIKLSGQRLNKTLNNILNISNIETRKRLINIKKHNLIKYLIEQVELFKAAAKLKGLSLNFQNKEEILNAYIDEELFVVIIDNLLNNAIKFTETGSITLIAKQQEDLVVIEVIDTGIGVPEKFHNLIFEEFRQASEGYNRNFEGTGLGLTIAKRYTELMGGTIGLKNNLEEISSGLPVNINNKAGGSTFVLTLPVNENITENLITTNWS